MKKIICFLILWNFISCSVIKENDIYSVVTKGEKINKTVFAHAEQIVKVNDGYFLLYNLSDIGDDSYDPHLLVCNNKLIVEGVGYFASEFIDSVVNDTVIAILNKYRFGRTNAYRNDLPLKIHLFYDTLKIDNGYGTINCTIIDSL